MALEIFDVNNNETLVQTWESVDHAYIVLDYKEPVRDKIKFDEDSFITYKWKGIYAPNNILDVPDLLIKYFGTRRVKTIVIRTHGSVVPTEFYDSKGKLIKTEDTDTVMICDNNKGRDDDRYISGQYLEEYLLDNCSHDINGKAIITQYIDALLLIATYVKDGGDLVIGSCRTGKVPRFLIALQKLTEGRINIHGLTKRSDFPYSYNTINDIRVEDGGEVTIKAEKTLNNISLIESKMPRIACACKIPAKLGNSQPVLLDDIFLTKNGVKYVYSIVQETEYLNDTQSSVSFPPIINPTNH